MWMQPPDPAVASWTSGAVLPMAQQPTMRQTVWVDMSVDRGTKHAVHLPMETAMGGRIEVAGRSLRMEPGLEQDLVGVDVADARDQLLIHQRRLESTATVSQQGREVGFGDCQSVRPEVFVGDEVIGIVDESDTSQPALVDQG